MIERITRTVIEGVVVLGLVWILTGCQTVRGGAQDAEWLFGRIADNIKAEQPEK